MALLTFKRLLWPLSVVGTKNASCLVLGQISEVDDAQLLAIIEVEFTLLMNFLDLNRYVLFYTKMA